jgi:hypothetical protein
VLNNPRQHDMLEDVRGVAGVKRMAVVHTAS